MNIQLYELLVKYFFKKVKKKNQCFQIHNV